MAANKLINFRCPDELLIEIENYGLERHPVMSSKSKRGSIEYDQSKAIRDILVAGLEALTNGEVKIELEVRQPRQQPDGIDIDAITAQISSQFEERFNRLEARLEEALKPSMRKRLVS